MQEAEDLYDVDGWLLIFAALHITFGVLTFLFLALSGTYALLPDPTNVAKIISIVTGAINIAVGVLILRTSRWALPAVAIALGLQLLLVLSNAFLSTRDSKAFTIQLVLQTIVKLAILYAWFQYFRTSKRVHYALGRNL